MYGGLYMEMKRLNQADSEAWWTQRALSGKTADVKATYGKAKAAKVYRKIANQDTEEVKTLVQ